MKGDISSYSVLISGPKFSGIEKALELDDVDIRLFGKPKAWNNRRLGVILSKNREIGQKAKSLVFINKKNNY